jgi:FMN phosphatase YigB (HAD superfamily)
MTMDDFNRTLGEKLGTHGISWQKYYLEAVDPIEEMHELVTWAAEHYHVGLLSNIMPGFIDAMIANGSIPNVPYAAIIDSSKTGAIKPEQAIYEAAQHYSNVEPEAVLLVDDSRSNLMAAEKMGWKVMWFDDYRISDSIARVRSALEF